MEDKEKTDQKESEENTESPDGNKIEEKVADGKEEEK